jgi:ATP-dependent Zn protease
MKLNEVANDLKNIKSSNYLRIWEPFMRKCGRICRSYSQNNFLLQQPENTYQTQNATHQIQTKVSKIIRLKLLQQNGYLSTNK